MIFTYDFCPTHFRMAENDRCGFLSFSWALLILGRSFFLLIVCHTSAHRPKSSLTASTRNFQAPYVHTTYDGYQTLSTIHGLLLEGL